MWPTCSPIPKDHFLTGTDKELGSSTSSDTEEDPLPANKCKKVRGSRPVAPSLWASACSGAGVGTWLLRAGLGLEPVLCDICWPSSVVPKVLPAHLGPQAPPLTLPHDWLHRRTNRRGCRVARTPSLCLLLSDHRIWHLRADCRLTQPWALGSEPPSTRPDSPGPLPL